MFNDHFFSFCIIRCYSPRLGMVSAPRTLGALRVSVFIFLFPKDDERGSIMLMGVQGLPRAAVAVKLMRNYDDHLSRCGVCCSNPTLRSRPEWRTRSRSISISSRDSTSSLIFCDSLFQISSNSFFIWASQQRDLKINLLTPIMKV